VLQWEQTRIGHETAVQHKVLEPRQPERIERAGPETRVSRSSSDSSPDAWARYASPSSVTRVGKLSALEDARPCAKRVSCPRRLSENHRPLELRYGRRPSNARLGIGQSGCGGAADVDYFYCSNLVVRESRRRICASLDAPIAVLPARNDTNKPIAAVPRPRATATGFPLPPSNPLKLLQAGEASGRPATDRRGPEAGVATPGRPDLLLMILGCPEAAQAGRSAGPWSLLLASQPICRDARSKPQPLVRRRDSTREGLSAARAG